MKHGDFTALAKDYIHRPSYSQMALKIIGTYAGMNRTDFKVADIGAGTGKLTKCLESIGLTGDAVEPNDAMRAEGIKAFANDASFIWHKGAAEATGLADKSYNWVLMGSSFHWANTQQALEEFHRIVIRGGVFTALWNPRVIEGDELQERIERMIEKEIPGLQRVSSGAKGKIGNIEAQLLSTPYFSDLFFVECPHEERMSKERYLGVWRSVNDIQVQAGERRFQKILANIKEMIAPYDEILVRYKTRAWSVIAR